MSDRYGQFKCNFGFLLGASKSLYCGKYFRKCLRSPGFTHSASKCYGMGLSTFFRSVQNSLASFVQLVINTRVKIWRDFYLACLICFTSVAKIIKIDIPFNSELLIVYIWRIQLVSVNCLMFDCKISIIFHGSFRNITNLTILQMSHIMFS